MSSQFIWDSQLELARLVSFHYLKSEAQSISLTETTELGIKASKRPSLKSSASGSNPAKGQSSNQRGHRQRGGFHGQGGVEERRESRSGYFPSRGRRGNPNGNTG